MPGEQLLMGQHARGRLKAPSICCGCLFEITEREGKKKWKGSNEKIILKVAHLGMQYPPNCQEYADHPGCIKVVSE